jgi:hypothetical protein
MKKALVLTLGLVAQTSFAQITSTQSQSSFLDNFSATLISTTLGINNDVESAQVVKNEYEIDVTYKLNNRHSLNFYQMLGHRLSEEITINEKEKTQTIQPTFYVADQTELSHFYLITSPRIKNLSIKTKLTYAAPTVEGQIENNYDGYLQARLQVHFLLNNQTINLGIRPYFRKHLISNLIWDEEKGRPRDMQLGTWLIGNFKLTDKISFDNMLNLRINLLAKATNLSDEQLAELKQDNNSATATTNANFYSYLRYAFGSNWNAFLHYRNESDFVNKNAYAVNITDEQASIVGIGAEVSF